jgi:hypothetical protein
MTFNYKIVVFLLLFNLVFFIAYIFNDFYWDNGVLDQPFNFGALMLLIVLGAGFVWYVLARCPHTRAPPTTNQKPKA